MPVVPVLATKAAYHRFQYVVTGIDNSVIKKNVNLTLQNFRSNLHVPMTWIDRQEFNRKAPELIQKAVEPYGYFRSQVKSTMTKTPQGWVDALTVTLGPALPITQIQIEVQGSGKNNPVFEKFLKLLPLHVNEPLQTEQYENIKTDLYNIATRLGYFDAQMVKSQIRINLQKYHAKIIIIFQTGARYRFGPTTFSSSPFHVRFLNRFLEYKQGEYYDAEKIEKTQEGLIAGNYFTQVLIKPEPKNAVNGYVPIHISIIPRKKKAYTLGLGYGTDTGIRGTLGFSLRRIGHDGHRFHTLMRASPNNSSLTAKYIIPGFHPARDQFNIAAGVSNMSQSTGSARNAKFGASYIISRTHWKNSLTLAYLTERYNIVNLPITSTQLVYPTLETRYTQKDHKTHPTRGIVIEAQLTGASQKVLSETSFTQIVMHLHTLYTIKKTQTRLLFRSDLGYTNIANLVRLPLSLQLFAGGERSVRGYGFNAIGANGGPGRNLVVGSTEIQQKIVGAFYLAGFVDAGVVGNQDLFHHINVGSGPGIAWVSPIGAMELTVAEAITQPNKPWTIQFTMGAPI